MPYIWDFGAVRVPEGAMKVRFNYSVANNGAEWSRLFFTPLGHTPVKYSFRDLGYAGPADNRHGVGVLHLSAPAPAGGVSFSYQVISWDS